MLCFECIFIACVYKLTDADVGIDKWQCHGNSAPEFVKVILTPEVELFHGLPAGRLLVLVVGDGGVLKDEPVLFIRLQSQTLGSDV